MHRQVLSFSIENANIEPGGLIQANTTEPVLRFSEGSEVTMYAPGSLRVRALDEHGARIVLNNGNVRAYVAPASSTLWQMDAGPFTVETTGGTLGVSWNPKEEQFDVRLGSGSVQVTGPMMDAPIRLREGQWLSVHGASRLSGGTARISGP